jgi:hypothetical protein
VNAQQVWDTHTTFFNQRWLRGLPSNPSETVRKPLGPRNDWTASSPNALPLEMTTGVDFWISRHGYGGAEIFEPKRNRSTPWQADRWSGAKLVDLFRTREAVSSSSFGAHRFALYILDAASSAAWIPKSTSGLDDIAIRYSNLTPVESDSANTPYTAFDLRGQWSIEQTPIMASDLIRDTESQWWNEAVPIEALLQVDLSADDDEDLPFPYGGTSELSPEEWNLVVRQRQEEPPDWIQALRDRAVGR